MREINVLCGQQMAALIAHSQLLKRINERITRLLPASLDEHVQVMNLRDGHLVLQVDSAVWATRLRFFSKQLLQQWDNELAGIPCPLAIHLRVVPISPSAPELEPAPKLSAQSAQTLESAAQRIEDSRLQKALLRLAKNIK